MQCLARLWQPSFDTNWWKGVLIKVPTHTPLDYRAVRMVGRVWLGPETKSPKATGA